VPTDAPESVDVSFSEKEVVAQWRSAHECTRVCRQVTVREGGCSKSEQSVGVHVDSPESEDVFARSRRIQEVRTERKCAHG
jgi:hypothetical protein